MVRSPWVFSREKRLNFLSPSSQCSLFNPLITFMGLLWTLSSVSLSFTCCGSQNLTQFCRCSLTSAAWSEISQLCLCYCLLQGPLCFAKTFWKVLSHMKGIFWLASNHTLLFFCPFGPNYLNNPVVVEIYGNEFTIPARWIILSKIAERCCRKL